MNAQLGKRRRRWPYALLIIALGFAAYTWLTLTWSYSDGERVGILQKVSRKGWVCKTVEGELAQYVVSGVMPQIWEFTVRDATIARRLNAALGQRVRLHYTEHRGVPSGCFGDTRYFVDHVETVEAPVPMPATPGPGSSQEQGR
ncbi:MAG: hypothetical protein JSR15_05695 [Proteobacteria bacterium]|nr:hypothetical protein [Pseudomonadota bacterium]